MSDRDATLGSGAVLESRYELIEEIARGGFGMVFRARQLQMDREVAVKTLPPEFVESDEMIERFRREARFASQLNHPNTVTIHDYGKHEAYLYLVMELLEGEDLADVLARERTVPLDRILPIARQVLKSLREAHEHNIVHRDLKPENIFLTEIGQKDEEVVKVLDFGIAKLARGESSEDRPSKSSRRRLTAEGTTMGTPIYMSPEQAAGDGVDHRTDLYALGVILYEMACGTPPFDHDESAVVMRRHIHAEVPDFHDPELRGTWLEDVVQIALRKHRKDRFQNAGEFLDAIDEAVARSKGGYSSLHEDSDSVLERYESDEADTSRRTPDSEGVSEDGGNENVIDKLESQDRERQSEFGNSSSIVTVLEEPGEPEDVVLLDEAKESPEQDGTAPMGGGPDRPVEHERGAPSTLNPGTEGEARESAPPERSTDPGMGAPRRESRHSNERARADSAPKTSTSGGRERNDSSWSWSSDEHASPERDERPPDPEVRGWQNWRRIVMTLLVLGLLIAAGVFAL